MGRGSSGSSSRGGGSHSSGSSRGGSFRGSSTSGRGRVSGGGDRIFSGGSLFSLGGWSGFGSSFGFPRYGRSFGGYRRTSISSLIEVGAISLFITVLLFIWSSSGVQESRHVTKSTIDREPLSKQYVTEIGVWYDDEMGWILSSSTVNSALKYFYDKTGVAPYLTIVEKVEGSYIPTGQQVWNYGAKLYDQLFEDEGHLLFVFQCPNGGTDYTMAAVTGPMAKTVVDDEALEILYDYIDYNFYTDKSDDDMFGDAFRSAADRMMVKTPSNKLLIFIVIAVVIVLFIVWQIMKAIFKRKAQEAQETVEILSQPIEKDEASDLADKYG